MANVWTAEQTKLARVFIAAWRSYRAKVQEESMEHEITDITGITATFDGKIMPSTFCGTVLESKEPDCMRWKWHDTRKGFAAHLREHRKLLTPKIHDMLRSMFFAQNEFDVPAQYTDVVPCVLTFINNGGHILRGHMRDDPDCKMHFAISRWSPQFDAQYIAAFKNTLTLIALLGQAQN